MTKEQKLLFLKQATKAMDSRWNLSTEIPKIGSGGSGIVVNPRAITIKEGYSEAQLRALVAQMTAEHIATIPQSQKAVGSVVYKWNETRPAILTPNIVSLNQEKDVGGSKAYGMSYASKKDWLFIMDNINHNMRVLKGSDLAVVMNIDTNTFGSDTKPYYLTTTPDAKRVAISQLEYGFIRILRLKDDLSGYELESSIDTGGGFSVGDLALDGVGATLVFTTYDNKQVKIYDLNDQGTWTHIKTYPIGLSCRGVEISKDGLEIYAVATDGNVRSAVKVNGVWGDISNIATLPSGYSSYNGKSLSLSLDKQVLYVADSGYDNKKGRINVFYKQEGFIYLYPFDNSIVNDVKFPLSDKSLLGSGYSDTTKKLGTHSKIMDGVKDNLVIEHLDMATKDYTFNVWVNRTSNNVKSGDSSIRDYVFAFGGYWESNSLAVRSDTDEHKFSITGKRDSGKSDIISSNIPFSQWDMYTLVSTPTSTIIYLNGVEVYKDTSGKYDKFDDIWLAIGGVYQSSSIGSAKGHYYQMNGFVDGLHIEEKALTQNEVTKLFKNNGLAWQHKYDINPTNPVANNYFGIGVALNDDNSVAFISEYESHKVYKYDISNGILDANSLDPFKDGSLKHFYKFDGNTVDSVGGANLPNNGISYLQGKYGQGVVGTEKVAVNLPTSIQTNFTVSFFATYQDNTSFAVSFGNSDSNWEETRFVIHSHDSNTLFVGTDVATREQVPSIPTGLHHFLTTIEGTTLKLYIDGVYHFTKEVTASNGLNRLLLGGYGNTGAVYLGNTIDHLQIFDRALTQEEVTKLYKAEVK